MLALFFVLAFAGLLVWAAACDVATMEIPNRISVLAVGLYPLAAFLCGAGWASIGLHLAVGVGALLICWGLFNLGVFGGGDAKLIAAASVWTGPLLFVWFLLWTAVAGGALALSAIAARARFKPSDRLPAFVNRFLGETGLPYAVAIAVGGLAVIADLPLWAQRPA
jgi:prepilin peptidase CpaA